MSLEFPFNLLAKTPAIASNVMANFNAIKTLLDGGLTQANFAEEGRIIMGSLANTIQPTTGAPAGEFALSGYRSVIVPAASKALITVTADIQATAVFGGPNNKVSGRVTPRIDNVDMAIYAEAANQSPQVTAGGQSAGVGATIVQGGSSDTALVNLSAGEHTFLLVGSTAYTGTDGFPAVTFWKSSVSWIIVPNAE